MKYAKRIRLPVEFPYLNKASFVLGKHGTWSGYDKHHVVRRYLPRKQIELVREALPEHLKPHLIGISFSEILLLTPHIHIEEGCVINFYQRVNGEITAFWEGEIEQDDRWSTDNGKGYINVNPDKIEMVESFRAQDGDVWILSTRQPHSVSIEGDTRSDGWQYVPENDNVRFIVQAFMDLPYQEVADYFDEVLSDS
jgi:hypothetical protein